MPNGLKHKSFKPHRVVLPRHRAGGRGGLGARLARLARAAQAVWFLVTLGLVAAPAAQAGGWQGAVGLTSDKVQRGISENDGQAVLLLDLGHAWDTGWAVAAGLAGPSYAAQGGQAEINISLSKAWQLDNDWLAQMGASRYEVSGQPRARAYRYKELHGSLAWRGQLTLAASVSPDTSRFTLLSGLRTGRVWSLDAGLHQRLLGRLAVDLGAGYQNLDGLASPGYAYGSLGLGFGWGPMQGFVTLINSRARAQAAAGASQAGRRWVGTLSYVF
jgi:uncharacterized protein (TIGR02001 family)